MAEGSIKSTTWLVMSNEVPHVKIPHLDEPKARPTTVGRRSAQRSPGRNCRDAPRVVGAGHGTDEYEDDEWKVSGSQRTVSGRY